MRKNSSTSHLFVIRTRQQGNPVVMEGFSYTAQGDIQLDAGNNRRKRRLAKAMLRKEGRETMSGFNCLLEQGQKRAPARFTANCFSDLSKTILSRRVQISITPEMTIAGKHNKKRNKKRR